MAQVPSEYVDRWLLINECSGSGLDFFWKNQDNIVYNVTHLNTITDPNEYSYIIIKSTRSSHNIVTSANNASGFTVEAKRTIYITGSGSSWTLTFTDTNWTYNCTPNELAYFGWSASDSSLYTDNNTVNSSTYWNSWKWNNVNLTFSSLSDAIDWLVDYTRNVNINVNGDDWEYTPPYSGGAGSGYIGNSLVSNKKMVGYNVPTSSAEGTKTESINEVSASAVSGKPKSGNGFARIKFLRES